MTAVVQTCEPGARRRRADGPDDRAPHPARAGRSTTASWSAVVSIGDVVKSRITQLTFERDQLDSYVHQT